MTTHPIENGIRRNLVEHAEIYAHAGQALGAVMAVHASYRHAMDPVRCSNCLDEHGVHLTYPCPTVERVAEQLGVERLHRTAEM